MKKLIFFLILIPVIAAGQLSVSFGVGAARQSMYIPDEGKQETLLAVSDISVGYEINRITFEGEIRPTLSRLRNSPNNLGGKVGYNLNGFIPAIGYYYNISNSDDIDYNTQGLAYSLKYLKEVSDQGALYVEGMYISKSLQLTAGIHYNF